MRNKFRFTSIVIILFLSLVVAACGNSGDNAESKSENDDNDNSNADSNSSVELGEKDITLPNVAWADAEARAYLIAQVLEDVGYNVDMKVVEAGPMFSSVADGSADFLVTLRLPVLHKDYWEEYEDDMTKVNEALDKAPISLTVPSYMDVDSIEDLKDNQELGEATNWTITGIDPGAGAMESTEEAMDAYGLDNWELQSSSEAAMISALGDAYDNEEPIIVTGWKPHWKFAEWDLKMLDDPRTIYGGDGDSFYIAARNGFKEDSPAAYKILEQYTEDEEQLTELMIEIHNGTDPEDVAKQFIKDNPDKVDEWTKGVKKE